MIKSESIDKISECFFVLTFCFKCATVNVTRIGHILSADISNHTAVRFIITHLNQVLNVRIVMCHLLSVSEKIVEFVIQCSNIYTKLFTALVPIIMKLDEIKKSTNVIVIESLWHLSGVHTIGTLCRPQSLIISGASATRKPSETFTVLLHFREDHSILLYRTILRSQKEVLPLCICYTLQLEIRRQM